MPVPGEVYLLDAAGSGHGGKGPRRVVVLFDREDGTYTTVYGTGSLPWWDRQMREKWTLLLHISPGGPHKIPISKDTCFYVEGVDVMPGTRFVNQPLATMSGLEIVDLQMTYSDYLYLTEGRRLTDPP